jgi:hypothetical protein
MSAYDLLQAYVSKVDQSTTEMEKTDTTKYTADELPPDTLLEDTDTRLINAANSTGTNKPPPGDMCCVVSKATKLIVNICEYFVSEHVHTSHVFLVKCGANGGVGVIFNNDLLGIAKV